MNTLAILQARVNSSRLPGKVLRPLLGAPMLLRQIERIKRAKSIDALLVATSIEDSDEPIQLLCESLQIPCFRGQLNDVLDRFYNAATKYMPDQVVRLTGDCPLTDPDLIDDIVRFHYNGKYDYSSNCHPPTFPDGLDVEVISFEKLTVAWREAVLMSDREHVLPFIWRQPKRFRIGNFINPSGDQSQFRWTVDESADFELVDRIYRGLYKQKPNFSSADVYEYLYMHPELIALNTQHTRNEGLLKSQTNDDVFKVGLEFKKVGYE